MQYVLAKIYDKETKKSPRHNKSQYEIFERWEDAVGRFSEIMSEIGPATCEIPATPKTFMSGGRSDSKDPDGKWLYHDHCVHVSVGLTVGAIISGLKSGEIRVDLRGHNSLSMRGPSADNHHRNELIRRLEGFIKAAESLPDNPITVMRAYDAVEFGETMPDMEIYCWDCDARMSAVLVDETTMALIDTTEHWRIRDAAPEKWSHRFDGLSEVPLCKCAGKYEDRTMRAEINVDSGELVFVNYFRASSMYDIPDEFKGPNLNSIMGRQRYMDHYASIDVGYGQMGNMSIDVFLREDGEEIIIGTDFIYNEHGEETEVQHSGFRKLGTISLDVWRWMCADMSVVRKHGEILPSKARKDDCRDMVKVKVKPGRWEIEHYYDMCADAVVYSRLKLKK